MNRITITLTLLLALAGAARAEGEKVALALPTDVAQALAEPQCAELIALNKYYWSLPENPLRQAATMALENAILGISGCGVFSAQLIRVEPLEGGNFFDPGNPLGQLSPGS